VARDPSDLHSSDRKGFPCRDHNQHAAPLSDLRPIQRHRTVALFIADPARGSSKTKASLWAFEFRLPHFAAAGIEPKTKASLYSDFYWQEMNWQQVARKPRRRCIAADKYRSRWFIPVAPKARRRCIGVACRLPHFVATGWSSPDGNALLAMYENKHEPVGELTCDVSVRMTSLEFHDECSR
jgi:hypothetical protein